MTRTFKNSIPNPNVDESLFGSNRKRTTTQSAGRKIAEPSIRIVDQKSLNRMKALSTILTEEEKNRLKREKELMEEATRKQSIERKIRMIEKEKSIRAHRQKIALEADLEAEKQAVLSDRDIAQYLHLDSVKRLKSQELRAKVFMGREPQIQDRIKRQNAEKQYEEHFDLQMEKDRLLELENRKKKNILDKEKRMEGRRILEEQIAMRNRQKIREEEAKDMEGKKILELYKNYEDEDRKKREEHRKYVEASIEEVKRTNERIKAMKISAKQREKEDERIAAMHLMKKAAEEEAKFQEEELLKKSKEERVQKLRAQQEKVQDNREKQDELRAKRIYEAKEKAIRQKEKDDEIKKTEAMLEIMKERKKQQEFKEQQKAFERKQDMWELQMAQKRTEEDHRRRHHENQIKLESKNRYKDLLLKQISDNKLSHERASIFEKTENSNGKKMILKEKIVVDKLRNSIIQKLKKEGVKDRYIREMMQ